MKLHGSQLFPCSRFCPCFFHQVTGLGWRLCYGIWLYNWPLKGAGYKVEIFQYLHVSQEFLSDGRGERRSSRLLADRHLPRLKPCCVPLTAALFLGIAVTLDNMLAKSMSTFALFFCDCALQWMLISFLPATMTGLRCTHLLTELVTPGVHVCICLFLLFGIKSCY